MEESELEEGEACSGQDDDSCIDPDALSYIDEKIQSVLGHFQKDFEGGVSAENLGAKFGGYGSFLPSYQRSPVASSQPRTPLNGAIANTSRSPHCSSSENPLIPASVSLPVNSNTLALQSLQKPGITNMGKISSEEVATKYDCTTEPAYGSKKSLKVRIKVGSDNASARNNAAIYSGLGLVTSPSSSPEDSPYESGGFSHEPQDMPGESPMAILQIMTWFTVPGGYMLSPLPDYVLNLTKKGRATGKDCKSGVPQRVSLEACNVVALSAGDAKSFIQKQAKPVEKIGRSREVNNSDNKDDKRTVLRSDIDTETPEDQWLVADALNLSISSAKSVDEKTERKIVFGSKTTANKMLDHSKEPDNILVIKRMSSPKLEQDNQLESAENIRSSDACGSRNEACHLRGKLNSRMSLDEKVVEERSTSANKDNLSDTWREGTSKIEKGYDSVKSNTVGHKEMKNLARRTAESQKHMSAQKATGDQDEEVILQRKDHLPERKRKLKDPQNNGELATESMKENLNSVSSTKLKEKKKSSHGRVGHSETKSKASTSTKEAGKHHSKESQGDVMDDVKAEQHQHKTEFLETTYREKPKDVKPENARATVEVDRTGGKNVDNPPVSEATLEASVNIPAPIGLNSQDTYGVAVPQAAVVIKENWVACDICQKWRLLPYENGPENLPNKWQCSMQTWLPGLNKCHISEEVTTKALNALYQIPAPESDTKLIGHLGATASVKTSADVWNPDKKLEQNKQCVPTIEKDKLGLNNESNAKSRSLNDMTGYPSETSLPKKFSLGHGSKSNDFITKKHNNKQKEKHRVQELCSDGGNISERNSKQHSKSKANGDVEHDRCRSSKKIKKEDSHYPIEDRYSNFDMAGRNGVGSDNGFSLKEIGKNSQKYSDYPSSKDWTCDPKGHLSASVKKLKNEVHAVPKRELKENSTASNREKSGVMESSAKKRKVEEWQSSQGHHTPLKSQQVLEGIDTAKEASTESEWRKHKKVKISKSGGKDSARSKTDELVKGCSARTVFSGSGEHLANGVDEGRGKSVKQELGHVQGSSIPGRNLECNDYLTKDLTYAHPPVAATSSSSKASSSRKNKVNFQERRGSPVESVSSSPLRNSITEKLLIRRSSTRKDNVTNVDASVTVTPKRSLDGESDGRIDQSGKPKEKASSIEEKSSVSRRAAASRALDLSEALNSFHSEANHLSSPKAEDHLKGGTHDGLSSPLLEDINVVNGAGNSSDRYNKYDYVVPHEDHTNDQDKTINHHYGYGHSPRKSGKSSLCFKEKDRSSKSDVGKGKVKASDDFRYQKESGCVLKIGNSCQTDEGIDSHGHSIYHEGLRDDKSNAQGKHEEKGYLMKKDSASKCSVGNTVGNKRDGHSNYEMQENFHTRGPSKGLKDHDDFAVAAGASCSKSILRENLRQQPLQQDEKSSKHLPPDRTGRLGLVSIEGKSKPAQPSKDKKDSQSRDPQAVTKHVRESRSEINDVEAVNSETLKVIRQPRKSDSQNGPRQATPNGPDAPSPLRKDGQPAATIVIKEARDLKHSANRLKNEGLELESTDLYFEAALKYLYGASLLEPPNFGSMRPGEADQSMLMYSETAKLCEFCAYQYERCKEMAAAALAYKCVEVAYMKAAYYKHLEATKDRRELHATLQMVPPGESPSSSASDVDNLNNQGLLDKAASAKGAASPQIVGNHVIAARNRPRFLRLLNYTNDMNLAFEATRKSRNAISASSGNRGREGIDGLSCVEKVLDFNFHNVEGLLRLVRLSMKSISS